MKTYQVLKYASRTVTLVDCTKAVDKCKFDMKGPDVVVPFGILI